MPDLIKKFFDTFEIEPYDRYYNCKTNLEGECKAEKSCCACENSEDVYCYPEITDHILLELICILSDWRAYLGSSYPIKANNILNLKQDILKDFLELFKWYEFKKCEKGIKKQIQELFKGE